MSESLLSKLAEAQGMGTAKLREDTDYSSRYIQLMKAEKKRLSIKAAGELAPKLNVDPELLFVAHNLHALKNRMAAGEVETHEAMTELAHVLKVAGASPAVDAETEADITSVDKEMADTLIAATGGGDTDEVLGRGLGGMKLTKKFAAGENYGGAQGVNPEERQLGRTLGGATVGRGPFVEDEAEDGDVFLGRGVAGVKLERNSELRARLDALPITCRSRR